MGVKQHAGSTELPVTAAFIKGIGFDPSIHSDIGRSDASMVKVLNSLADALAALEQRVIALEK